MIYCRNWRSILVPGHPEPLKGGNDVRWSRRLSASDRIIYDIYDDVVTVLVIQVGGHYEDK